MSNAAPLSVLSFAILAISALSFTRATQRLYVRAWRLPKLGVRGNVWGLVWLAAFVLWTSLQPVLIELFDGVIAFVVAEALATGLWLMTPWVLVGGRLPWRRLLPQAVLTAFGLLCVSIAAAVYAPRAISSASQDFGVIGVAFTLVVSWGLSKTVLKGEDKTMVVPKMKLRLPAKPIASAN